MAVEQLPGRVREFAHYLTDLLDRLDQGDGWCGVFWQRDPDGMRACLGGREVPPWDVVEALLRDLAARYAPATAAAEAERARALHDAALAAHDALPGVRDALGDRLDAMLREQRYAADRQAALSRRLAAATTRAEADALRLDLAWARDDHTRATARCAELRGRLARLGGRGGVGAPAGDGYGGEDALAGGSEGSGGLRVADADADADADAAGTRGARDAYGDQPAPARTRPGARSSDIPAPAHTPAPAPRPTTHSKPRRRPRGSARFAGMAPDEGDAPMAVPPADVPPPAVPPAGARAPRGARFAGAADGTPEPPVPAEPVSDDGRAAVARTVARLAGLRRAGRTGEAHALLAEAAHWPPARLPLLAAALREAGLGADWATLLWEAASLPAGRLVAAADALAAAGHGADGEQILRHGTARPAAEIGHGVLGLVTEGRDREARVLLDAYVRGRTAEEAARSAAPDPPRLVPLLLRAARGVSEETHWDLVHALRVAQLAT
ncbi:hypothetical protein ABZ397_15550 [Streptomyces sp. NPDC005876]|uniref:hypothetical protein n=1 Tax=Streptomyces sp. NPDC005876 TaxID=3157076 RepID=UPI0033C815D5